MRTKVFPCLLLIAAATSLAIFAQAEFPLPEFYGVYIVAEGKLFSTDGPNENRQPIQLARTEKDFERGSGTVEQIPVLPDSLNFLVFMKGDPLQVAAQLKLRQIPFVRRMTINENDPHYRKTYQPNMWVAATDFGYSGLGTIEVELRFKPVKGEDEMVLAVPSVPLSPGLYIFGDDLLFAVPPIDTAMSSRCIDAARPMGLVAGWRTWPCTDVPATAQPGQAHETVDAIIAHYIESIGGEEALRAVETVRTTGTMNMGGLRVPVKIERKRPEKTRVDMEMQGKKMITAFDGEVAWNLVENGSTKPELLSGDQRREIESQSEFDGPLVDYKKKGHQVELVGQEEVEGDAAYKLKVTRNNGDVVYIYLDSKNFLPLQAKSQVSVQGKKTNVTVKLSDYREVGGILMPYSIEQLYEGISAGAKFIFDRIEVNVAIEDGRFTFPE